jgi:hypothetical protein
MFDREIGGLQEHKQTGDQYIYNRNTESSYSYLCIAIIWPRGFVAMEQARRIKR